MKSKRIISIFLTLLIAVMLISLASFNVFAETDTAAENAEAVETVESDDSNVLSSKAIAAAIVIGLAAAAGAIGMAMAISKSAESMARQPEAAGKINSAMMLGLVFIETAIIYALIVAILIIFVL